MQLIELSSDEFNQIIKTEEIAHCHLCGAVQTPYRTDMIGLVKARNSEYDVFVDRMKDTDESFIAGPSKYTQLDLICGCGHNPIDNLYIRLVVCTCCNKIYGIYCNPRKEAKQREIKNKVRQKKNELNNMKLYKAWDREDDERLNKCLTVIGESVNDKTISVVPGGIDEDN